MKHASVRKLDVDLVLEEIHNRLFPTLAGGEFARLMWVAGTRDYNTGAYRHVGLTYRYNEEAIAAALAMCHHEVFDRLASAQLVDFVRILKEYFLSTREKCSTVVSCWQDLESYRVLVPMLSDDYSRALFFANVQFALRQMRSESEYTTHESEKYYVSRIKSWFYSLPVEAIWKT